MPDITGRELRLRLWRQAPLLIALVLLWVVLWGNYTLLDVLTGIIVAVIVTRVFYLPPVDFSGRVNVWYSIVFLWYFITDVMIASVQVAWQAIRPRPVPKSSIIAIQLRTRSDLVMTLDAIAMSLVPGSLVVEVDRERSILYLHTFDTESEADVEKMRETVLIVEARIVRSLGSRDDLERIGHVPWRERRRAKKEAARS